MSVCLPWLAGLAHSGVSGDWTSIETQSVASSAVNPAVMSCLALLDSGRHGNINAQARRREMVECTDCLSHHYLLSNSSESRSLMLLCGSWLTDRCHGGGRAGGGGGAGAEMKGHHPARHKRIRISPDCRHLWLDFFFHLSNYYFLGLCSRSWHLIQFGVEVTGVSIWCIFALNIYYKAMNMLTLLIFWLKWKCK